MAMGREALGWEWRDGGGHGVSGRNYRAGWWCECGEALRLGVAHSAELWGRAILVCDAVPVTVAVAVD